MKTLTEKITSAQVAEFVDEALTRIVDDEFTCQNAANVIVNADIGPEIPLPRVRYALGRNPRVELIGSTHDGLGPLHRYRFVT